jgi:hypothetical protein
MARTSWNEPAEPLLTGHARGYRDNAAQQIVIETTKYNPAGSGLEICRMEFGRAAEARAILALADLLEAAEPFATLGKRMELDKADAEAPLLTNAALQMVITVGDVQRIMAACEKVYPPQMEIPPGARLRRGAGKRQKPKPPH